MTTKRTKAAAHPRPLDEDEDEDEDEAVRSVRARLLTPYDGDLGVFEARRAWEIIDVLAGGTDAGDFSETLRSCEYFTRLGDEVLRFLLAFVARRAHAKRGRKKYVPDKKQLRTRFGDDWELVRTCWPVVRFLEPLRDIRCGCVPVNHTDSSTGNTAEQSLRLAAFVLLDGLSPNKFIYDDVKLHLGKKLAGLRGHRPDLLTEDLVSVALAPGRAQERMLSHTPTESPAHVYKHWIAAARNGARDYASSPVPLGRTVTSRGPRATRHSPATDENESIDEQELRLPRGTIRSYKSRGLLPSGNFDPDKVDLAAIVRTQNARRRHHDPNGNTYTAVEVAEKLGCKERTARKVITEAIAAGDVVDKRLPDSSSYAFARSDIELLRPFVPAPRSPKNVRTMRKAAKELHVPVATVIEAAKAFVLSFGEHDGKEQLSAVGDALELTELSEVPDKVFAEMKRRLKK